VNLNLKFYMLDVSEWVVRDVGNNGHGNFMAYSTIFLEKLRKTRNTPRITLLWTKNWTQTILNVEQKC
jgi:hypothetical protein